MVKSDKVNGTYLGILILTFLLSFICFLLAGLLQLTHLELQLVILPDFSLGIDINWRLSSRIYDRNYNHSNGLLPIAAIYY